MNRIYKSKYRDTNTDWRRETTEQIFKRIISLSERDSETKQRIRWIKGSIEEAGRYQLIKQSHKGRSFLDIGGGSAVFAFEFKDSTWKPHIVDPSADDEFLRIKLGLPFIRNFYKPGQFKKKFGLISLIYVLEHVSNPHELLRNIRKDLTENALLYIEVPDAIAFSVKPKTDDIFNSCHLWMFDPEALLRLLKICGYDILSLKRVKTLRGHFAIMALAKVK